MKFPCSHAPLFFSRSIHSFTFRIINFLFSKNQQKIKHIFFMLLHFDTFAVYEFKDYKTQSHIGYWYWYLGGREKKQHRREMACDSFRSLATNVVYNRASCLHGYVNCCSPTITVHRRMV